MRRDEGSWLMAFAALAFVGVYWLWRINDCDGVLVRTVFGYTCITEQHP